MRISTLKFALSRAVGSGNIDDVNAATERDFETVVVAHSLGV